MELSGSHSSTLPCENYLRMSRMVAATSKHERGAIAKEFASATADEERVRLVKSSYAAMKIAYCNVPAHQLAVWYRNSNAVSQQ